MMKTHYKKDLPGKELKWNFPQSAKRRLYKISVSSGPYGVDNKDPGSNSI